MPKMTNTAQEHEERPLLAEGAQAMPPTDDIADPPLPMPMVADLQGQRVMQPEVDPATPAGQAVMSIDEALWKITTHATMVLKAMEGSWDGALRAFNGNQQVIEALTAALTNYRPLVPFTASVNVTSPSGFPMRLEVSMATREAFLSEMGELMGFLKANEFSPGVPF